MWLCPSCKKKISAHVKKCPNCGLMIPTKSHSRISRAKAAVIAVTIIITLAIFALSRISERDKPITVHDSSEKIRIETLKDIYGAEFSPDGIVAKFNSFMRDEGDDSLSISELVLESGETEDIYNDIKNDDYISISMYTPKGRAVVTSVSVSAQSEKTEAFIAYCYGLMSIFTPTMKADIRQQVLSNMTGYTESGDITLHDENTYIIVGTKYIFTHSGSKVLNMLIEQMPSLEEVHPGDLPPMIR